MDPLWQRSFLDDLNDDMEWSNYLRELDLWLEGRHEQSKHEEQDAQVVSEAQTC